MLGCGRPVSLLGGAFAVGSRCLSAICFCCEVSWWPSLELRPQRLSRKDADARLPSMMNISTGQRALPVLHRACSQESCGGRVWKPTVELHQLNPWTDLRLQPLYFLRESKNNSIMA